MGNDADCEKRNQEYVKRLKEFRPMDDTFMRCMFRKSPAATEKCLQIITYKDSLQVIENKTQADLKRLVGARSITLDVLATDDSGKKYDMEVQRDKSGASIKRLRYHGSALDIENLDAGQDFDELPDVYVIFITEKDMFDDGLPLHEMILYDTATGKIHDDGKHLVYVNGEYRGNDAVGDLMHDFNCRNASDMRIKEMRDVTHYLKETEGGREYMCEIMEDIKREGAEEKARDVALRMIRAEKYSDEEIINISGLDDSQIKELRSQKDTVA